MLREGNLTFLNDELGGGTIMGLLWFMLLVGITGMAVDTTNGFRNRTMLQATADAAVLAAVIDLPDEAAALASAVASSQANMPDELYGPVLVAGDVEIGAWRVAVRDFEEGEVVVDALDPAGGLFPDSVRVTLHQTAANANAVPVNFLRIMGLQSWDVNVEAVAQRYLPDCLTDGLVARGIVDISSNNGFINEICIHGQQGVEMQNHNDYELGVNVSMPDLDYQLVIPTGGMESNPGLLEAVREQSFEPRMVNHVNEIMADILALEDYVMPSYIDTSGGEGGGFRLCIGMDCVWISDGTGGTPLTVEVRDEKWDFADAAPGNVYHIQCSNNKTVGIPNGTELWEVVIVADCLIGVGSGVFLHDMVLASAAGVIKDGKKDKSTYEAGLAKHIITFSSGVQLGAVDNCQPGGGVLILANASIHFSSTTGYDGVQIVASGDVDLGARDMGINGINVQAGGDISLTRNNMFGLCSGGAPNLQTVAYYRLVH